MPQCRHEMTLEPGRISHIHVDNWDPSLQQWLAFQLGKFSPFSSNTNPSFTDSSCFWGPSVPCSQSWPSYDTFTVLWKRKRQQYSFWRLDYLWASVYLESLQRKTTKEHELWQVIFSSLFPFTSYMSLEKLSSLSLGFLICKLGIPFPLHSSWRIQ